MPRRARSLLPEPAPLRLDTARLIAAGVVLWVVALIVVLGVPALREGSRSLWPWICVTGVVGGLVAWWYVRRGRGNASDA